MLFGVRVEGFAVGGRVNNNGPSFKYFKNPQRTLSESTREPRKPRCLQDRTVTNVNSRKLGWNAGPR